MMIETILEKLTMLPMDLYDIFASYTTDPVGLIEELINFFSTLI